MPCDLRFSVCMHATIDVIWPVVNPRGVSNVALAPHTGLALMSGGVNATSPVRTGGGYATSRYAFDHDRLDALMTAHAVNDAQLAARTGLHRSNVKRIRTGSQTPSLIAAAAIADALGVTVDLLVKRADS